MVLEPAVPESIAAMRSSQTAVGWLAIAWPPLADACADQSGFTYT